MRRQTKIALGIVLIAAIGLLGLSQTLIQRASGAQVGVPHFEVDPFWPKPLPNNWRLGSAIGVWVDAQDNVWIVHRSSATLAVEERAAEFNPPQGECCSGAPPILAFDPEGNLLKSWGAAPGQEYQGIIWPESNHGIFIDGSGNVWMGANGASDSQILKFTQDGKVLAQYGVAGARAGPDSTFVRNSHDPVSFGRVAKIFVDPAGQEAFIADGYFNRRVAVIDANTGQMKRYWGAYGNRPDDNYVFGPQGQDDTALPQQFRGPVHCADLSYDNLVYVCDRQNNRLQVFTKDGTFVKEHFYAPRTLRSGSTWDVAFSRDPEQRYLFMVDGVNERVRVILRETLEELTSFGGGGRQPGQFYGVHSIATDSKGNIYTTETYEGKRLQKFVYVGDRPVSTKEQGVPWPARP
jgi:DNA-binding beta-propeller fold protein YncE